MIRRALLIVTLGAAVVCAAAQPGRFGAEGDLSEQLRPEWWQRERAVATLGGLSLIGAQWRAATKVRLEMAMRQTTFRLTGTLRIGPLGRYAADTDEWYDLVRLIDFARLNLPRTRPVHFRVGMLDGMRLGVGHVVNYYGTSTAWDQRTVGAEFHYGGRLAAVSAFTGDVRLRGVSGARVDLKPLFRAASLPAQSLRVGFNVAADRTDGGEFQGYSTDMQFDLYSLGGVSFAPYVSYAWYASYGDGLAFGADLYAEQFLDLLSFQLRIGAFYNSRQFIPGYVGALYAVHNLRARIVRASDGTLAGVTLEKSRGASDLLTEFMLEVRPSFSVRYYYRRHFGVQQLSEFHFRLFVRSRDRLRFEVGVDKLGAGGFLGIFGDYDDMSALIFGTEYRLTGALQLSVTALYSFEEIGEARYLVQRRFEPVVGLRVRF